MRFDDFLADPALGGAAATFRDLQSWRPWLTFAAATYGLPLDASGKELFAASTGRVYSPPPGGWREVACVVGRQAGKTRFGATIVAFEAIAASPVHDGERYVLLLAQDHRGAVRTAFAYIRAVFDASPILRRAIVRETASTLTLDNGVVVAAYPCRPAAVRGVRALVVLADELAFYRSSEALPQDAEMLRAVRPCLAMTGGRLIILSSPHAQVGALYDLHRRYYGRADGRVLVWQASAPTMNPLLAADYLERMRETDPAAYRSEVLGQFRDDVSSFVTREALEACIVGERRELSPTAGPHYVAFVDPSGGSRDSFTLAVAHWGEERVVLDCIRERRPPFNPDDVVQDYAATLGTYGVTTVSGDRYAGEWPRERFRAHGVDYVPAQKSKSDLYLSLLPLVNGGRVQLLDDERLIGQLVNLERRTSRGGRDSIDHGSGSHDDVANAVAGACALAERETVNLEDLDWEHVWSSLDEV
jgi:hypothetical protein